MGGLLLGDILMAPPLRRIPRGVAVPSQVSSICGASTRVAAEAYCFATISCSTTDFPMRMLSTSIGGVLRRDSLCCEVSDEAAG